MRIIRKVRVFRISDYHATAPGIGSQQKIECRLLELNPKEPMATQARKVVKFAESQPADAVPIDYDERNPFVVCSVSHTGHTLPLCSGV